MKFTTETLENCEAVLTIEVETERLQTEMQKAARRLAGRGRIPGYRKGKAPYNIIARHYGDGAIFEEMLDVFSQDAYREALRETGIEPYAPGSLLDVQQDPLTLKLSIPLPPQVDLADYREIRKEFPDPVVTDEQVSEALERIRKDQGSWVPVERPAQAEDMISVTFRGEVDGSLVFDELEDFPLIVGKPYGEPIPGFGDKLVGANAGDELSFALDVPEDDPRKELAGKPCQFAVRVLTVKTLDLPPLDDDLAKMVGDYDSLDALRDKVREAMLEEQKRHAEEQFAHDVLDMMVAQSKIKYPAIMLEEQLDGMMEDMERQLKRQERDLDSYLSLSGQTREDFRAGLKPRGERNLHRSLVLGEITGKEKVKVAPDEFQQEYNRLAEAYVRAGLPPEMVESEEFGRRVFSDVLTQKTLSRLTEIATGRAPSLDEEPAASQEPAESAEPEAQETEA